MSRRRRLWVIERADHDGWWTMIGEGMVHRTRGEALAEVRSLRARYLGAIRWRVAKFIREG